MCPFIRDPIHVIRGGHCDLCTAGFIRLCGREGEVSKRLGIESGMPIQEYPVNDPVSPQSVKLLFPQMKSDRTPEKGQQLQWFVRP